MTEILHTGRHLELVKEGKWEFVRRHKASAVVAIIAVTPAEELLLVEQHRVPVGASVIELPAGLVGDEDAGEDLLIAANRELDEETGWTAKDLRIINRGPSSAGLTSEVVTMVHARNLTRTSAGGGVPGEGITVHAIKRAHIVAWLAERAKAGYLIDHKVFAGLWWLGQSV
ncbi:MAG: NUDIX hydrolase [Planctomycetes bacterium]|nr:NUDIX hydrolase [Planctomycetota bacterium]